MVPLLPNPSRKRAPAPKEARLRPLHSLEWHIERLGWHADQHRSRQLLLAPPVALTRAAETIGASHAATANSLLFHAIPKSIAMVKWVISLGAANLDAVLLTVGTKWIELNAATGALISLLAKKRITPVVYAIMEGRLDVLHLLLASGASPNKAPKADLAPIQVAYLSNEIAACKMLAEFGADLNHVFERPDGNQTCLLQMATEDSRLSFVKWMLNKGAKASVELKSKSSLMSSCMFVQYNPSSNPASLSPANEILCR